MTCCFLLGVLMCQDNVKLTCLRVHLTYCLFKCLFLCFSFNVSPVYPENVTCNYFKF